MNRAGGGCSLPLGGAARPAAGRTSAGLRRKGSCVSLHLSPRSAHREINHSSPSALGKGMLSQVTPRSKWSCQSVNCPKLMLLGVRGCGWFAQGCSGSSLTPHWRIISPCLGFLHPTVRSWRPASSHSFTGLACVPQASAVGEYSVFDGQTAGECSSQSLRADHSHRRQRGRRSPKKEAKKWNIVSS
jgi:hypothetical protein